MFSTNTVKLLLASTWFQIVWLMAVWGNYQWQWLTVICVVVTLLFSMTKQFVPLKTLALLWLAGLLLDSLNQQLGLLVFDSQLLPIWLVMLWGIFVWYARFLVPLVSQYPLIFVSIIGGFAGGFSYLAGYKLQAVQFSFSGVTTFAILVIEWSLFILLILRVMGGKDGKMA